MERLEVSGAVRPIYGSLGVKRLISKINKFFEPYKMYSDELKTRTTFIRKHQRYIQANDLYSSVSQPL